MRTLLVERHGLSTCWLFKHSHGLEVCFLSIRFLLVRRPDDGCSDAYLLDHRFDDETFFYETRDLPPTEYGSTFD